MITFTLDLEDHRSNTRYEKRYPKIIRRVLELLNQNSTKGTFFVVGTIVKNDPELIREIADQGHELAFHSYSHKQLQLETQDKFLQETKIGKQELEDVSGQNVIGYRAPVFSLTRKTLWCLDILRDLGFEYSSSVLPAKNPLNGFPDAPEVPFHWSNGLLEIPVPVSKIGPIIVPYLGGVYLRYLPKFMIKYLIELNQDKTLWTYCHPYDFDENEPFFKIKGAGFLTSLILWFNRSKTENKIEYLLSLNKDVEKKMTFSEKINAGFFEKASKFKI